jgi:predicted anti-sigma-YlaC factor YlaD
MTESGPHISCQDVVELVTDYLEAALASEEAALLEQHLNFCEGCVWYVDQTRTTIETVGQIAASELTDETRTRLLAVFRDWKRS